MLTDPYYSHISLHVPDIKTNSRAHVDPTFCHFNQLCGVGNSFVWTSFGFHWIGKGRKIGYWCWYISLWFLRLSKNVMKFLEWIYNSDIFFLIIRFWKRNIKGNIVRWIERLWMLYNCAFNSMCKTQTNIMMGSNFIYSCL